MAERPLWSVTVNGTRCYVWADDEPTAVELVTEALRGLSGAMRSGRPKAIKATASVASKAEREAVLSGARQFDQFGAIGAPTDTEG